MIGRPLRCAMLVLLLLGTGLLASPRAWALGDDPVMGQTVTQYLTPAILQAIFPGADRIGEVGGTPPSAAVYKAGQPIGYIFSTWDVTRSRGYSNRPLVLLVGLSMAGRIAGVKLVHHTEPIVLLGVNDEKFFDFTKQFTGYDIMNGVDVARQLTPYSLTQAVPNQATTVKVDGVSRATTSSVLMSDAIVRGARIVARSRGILPATGQRSRVDLDRFAFADWPALEKAEAIAHLHLTYGDVLQKLREHGATGLAGNGAMNPGDSFLDFYVALVTPAGIGINLLGKSWYDQYSAGRGIDDQILLVAANGRTSILGEDWRHADPIASIELVQREKTIHLSGKQVEALTSLHAKRAPDLTEQALIFLSGGSNLDPSRPWQVRLLVAGKTADGKPSFADFAVPYKLPDSYLLKPVAGASADNPATDSRLPWQAIWRSRAIDISILGVALAALASILLMQDRISRRPRLHRWLRIGFLTWTLVWLGWYAGAQVTVVQVITWIHTLVTDFRWDYLLADPLTAIILAFTIAGLFVWGRGAFCGWLCPFGALQELANQVARRFGVPQIRIPVVLHGRLVIGKYLLFVVLLAASFFSWNLAMAGAEIEPFKAAIILRFATEWPLVAYALALLAASLFVERFYCRFACPLGGGLAIFGKVRLFHWLKRHPECGSRCRACETICPVGAIKRNGQINMNECFFCLDCQVTYYDDHTCPPMVWRRKLLQQQSQKPSAIISGNR